MCKVRVLAPLLVLLCACSAVEVGRDFELSTFDAKVQRGVTTQEEVRAWLGTPNGIGISVESSGDRYGEWSYYLGGGNLSSLSNARLKYLQIKFDREGVVRAYNWSGEHN